MASMKNEPQSRKPRRPPATTPEARENQMISLAVDLAEKQLRDGTASSQVVTHFLKLATSREKLEQKKISLESELLRARVDSIEQQASMEKVYKDALNAMRSYSGQDIGAEYED